MQGRVGKAVELVHRSLDVLRVLREEGGLCWCNWPKARGGFGHDGRVESTGDKTRRDETG